MCYLPGSEAKAIANVLVGDAPFSGTLPMPWYASTDQIGTDESMFPLGYGLTY
jgi:beta-glucosidase